MHHFAGHRRARRNQHLPVDEQGLGHAHGKDVAAVVVARVERLHQFEPELGARRHGDVRGPLRVLRQREGRHQEPQASDLGGEPRV